jgi:putative transposase
VRELVAELGFTAHLRSRGEEVDLQRRDPDWRARRWVVERSHSWLNRNRGLLVRWSKKPENHQALHHLAFGVIAWKAALAEGLPG